MNAPLRNAFAAAAVLALWLAANVPRTALADGAQRVAAQLLTVQGGFVFLTDGQAFKLSDGVTLLDAKGAKLKTPPRLGAYVRLTFDANGTVTEIEAGQVPFSSETSLADVRRYSVVPPLAHPTGPTLTELRNERVTVAFVVQVPTTTLPGDSVYMQTSETSWNPLAIRMDRIDSQHFRAVLAVPLGSRFRYLYTRGNSQSIERGPNGLQRAPRALIVGDLEKRTVLDKIAHWGDEVGLGVIANPQNSPTPFNPAPYPNLPPVKINPAPPRP